VREAAPTHTTSMVAKSGITSRRRSHRFNRYEWGSKLTRPYPSSPDSYHLHGGEERDHSVRLRQVVVLHGGDAGLVSPFSVARVITLTSLWGEARAAAAA